MNKFFQLLLKNKTQFILRISLLLFTTLLIIVSVYNLHFPLIRSVSKYDGLPDVYKLLFYSLAIGSNVYNAHQSEVYDFILDSMAIECIVVSTIFMILQISNLIKKRTSITYPLFLVGFIIHFICRLSNNESKVFIVLFLAVFALIFFAIFFFLISLLS